MADETTSAGTTAPAATTTAPSTTTQAAPDGANPPPWLAPRLEEARRIEREAILRSLGVTDPEKAKAAIAAATKAEEEAKTHAQKLGETAKTLEAERQARERLETAVKSHAERSMSTLSDEQRAAVRKIAPDTDPAAQLNAIDALAPTWAKPAPQATTTTTTTVKDERPATPAAGTAPAPMAPAGSSGTVVDHAAIYADLSKRNPIAAARYATEHATEIYKS